MGKRKKEHSTPDAPNLPRLRVSNMSLMVLALLSPLLLYWPVLGAGWFYDDHDYVLNDPRLEHLELFLPSQCTTPPVLENSANPSIVLPGYERPLIADRYLWRLSFALERRIFGLSPAIAHSINLLLHLAAIGALYFALARLIELYFNESSSAQASDPGVWRILPGLAAFIFSIHPWASEPACYVSARDGSLGTIFFLLGVGSCTYILSETSTRAKKFAAVLLAVLFALAAFASKENFIIAPAIYALACGPILWNRLWTRSRGAAMGILAGTVVSLILVGWLGIQASERARGLFAQTAGGRGAEYFFQIQSPLLMKTLADQIPTVRMALETNHPDWPAAACWLALAANGILFLAGTLGGLRWPLFLTLGGFFIAALPTNSFLPRPDFLAMRNFYLPTACMATLLAGGMLWLQHRAFLRSATRWRVPVGCSVGLIYWAASTGIWARQFAQPEAIWRRTVTIAPDHSGAHLNLASAILKENANRARQTEAEQEINAALKAEESPTMAWQTPRPRAVRRALALRMLGNLRVLNGQIVEAEDYFRRSFAEQPLVVTWTAWAETAFAQGARKKVADVLMEGENHWHDAWWTRALRGRHQASTQTPESLQPNVLADLSAAEAAADAQQPELRSLQGRTLFALAQTPAARPRIDALITRMIGLGVSKQDIEQLKLILHNRN